MLCPSISYDQPYKHEILCYLILKTSVPKSTVVCAHVKFQWQNLLCLVVDHELCWLQCFSVCQTEAEE